MTTQSEKIVEDDLVAQLTAMGYARLGTWLVNAAGDSTEAVLR
jgi:hypothetical protein